MGLFTNVYKLQNKSLIGAPVSGGPLEKQFVLNISNLDSQLLSLPAKVIWNFGPSAAEYISNNLFEIVKYTYTETGLYKLTALVYIGNYFMQVEQDINIGPYTPLTGE